MKVFAAILLIFIFAVAINAELEHLRGKRSVTTFGSHGSTVTDTGHVLTHGNNRVTTANRGNVGTVGNVHNSVVSPHGTHHNNVHNVANSGPAGTHNSVVAVHSSHTYRH
uniref:Uncharacterized protein n=1 Tax=Panagrolaimus sp. ES5 TaxID=591445 RepID=A0AC34FJD2_9BILA